MKPYSFVILSLSVLLLTSCKSLSKLNAKDHSAAKKDNNRRSSNGKLAFIDDIEVTPGAVVVTRHKTSSSNAKKTGRLASDYSGTNNALTATGIENANLLQLKYAVITDATVEKLTNILLLETIDKWWGTRYCMGGITDNCIDCSAFTQILMRDVYKINLPRTAKEQYDACDKIELEDLQEGDLVFFHTSGRNISHVGIYLLNNKFVHAATSGGVMISDLNEKYWQPRYRGAGRVLKS